MTTARTTPHGIKMDDGFSTKIAFAADPDISFWEKTVTPPGIDGGDAIETTTMHNTTWRSMAARALKTLTESSITVAWDPQVYDQIVALINVEGLITVWFPNGDALDFYGFLKSFTPGDMSEGSPPEAEISIVPTNINPLTGAEAAPVFTEIATAT
jgi:hypothetical protein